MFDPPEERRDREVTMGPGLLAILALGLFTLCGVCFVFGYAVGHRSSQPAGPAHLVASATPPALQPASSQPKPLPTENTFKPHRDTQAPAVADSSATDATEAAGDESPTETAVSAPSRPATAPTVMETALPTQPVGGQPASAGIVRPALPGGSPAWMVQIAAVSHREDAAVLVGALRQHGYAVSVHNNPLDGLMHVQVGPFASRNDASAMRQRLLNDGYNAIIQP